MTTVGCSEGADATAWSTEVTSTRIKGLVGNEGYEATECLYAPKQGRSGGGLFTFEEGLVAGVCNFAEPRGKRGLYASPRSIHKILNRNKLQICYDTRKTDPGADNTLLASRRRDEDRRGNNPRANDIVYRSQDPARKPIPMPSPEVLGMDSPNRSLASNPNSGRPPSERSGGWRSESSPERSRSVEMRDEQGGTRSAALNVSPSAVRDPFATVPTEPAAAAQTTEPTTTRSGDALRTDTAKGWKAVRPQ